MLEHGVPVGDLCAGLAAHGLPVLQPEPAGEGVGPETGPAQHRLHTKPGEGWQPALPWSQGQSSAPGPGAEAEDAGHGVEVGPRQQDAEVLLRTGGSLGVSTACH
jgi:hypothetical protein